MLGNVYTADTNNHVIRKVTPTGAIATIAGTGTAGFTTTNTAITTELSAPNGVSVDALGNVYIADTNNHLIRKVTPTGAISTIAGTGTAGSTTTTKATTTRSGGVRPACCSPLKVGRGEAARSNSSDRSERGTSERWSSKP